MDDVVRGHEHADIGIHRNEQRFGGRQQWRSRLETRRGFGGHEGIVGDLSLTYQARAGRTILNVGPRAAAASKDFTRTFFGVDAAQSIASGLVSYQPKGGLVSYGVGGSLIHALDRHSAITAFTSLERLGGVAKNSLHMKGQAADLRLQSRSVGQMAKAAAACSASENGVPCNPAAVAAPISAW